MKKLIQLSLVVILFLASMSTEAQNVAKANSITEKEAVISMVVYPNLSRGDFKFQSNMGNIELIELFSQNGQLPITSGNVNRNRARIDLSSFKAQIITARIAVNGRIIHKRLVKN